MAMDLEAATNAYAGLSNDAARLRAQAERAGYDIVAGLVAHGLEDGARVLDVGCGLGVITRAIARHCPASAVTGVDHDPIAIGEAQAEPAGVTFAVGDIHALPFPDGSFDFVAVSLVLMHLKAPEAAIAECTRVLAPGGRLCVIDVDDAFWLLDPPTPAFETLKALLARWYEQVAGTRHLGRRLPRLLEGAGLEALAFSTAAHNTLQIGREAFNRTYLEIFRVQGPRLAERGLVSPQELERLIGELDRVAASDYFATISACFASGVKR